MRYQTAMCYYHCCCYYNFPVIFFIKQVWGIAVGEKTTCRELYKTLKNSTAIYVFEKSVYHLFWMSLIYDHLCENLFVSATKL